MKDDNCPRCGSDHFYVKNPDDEYEIYEFTCRNGEIQVEPDADDGDKIEIDDQTEIYCNRCAWHDKAGILKK